MDIKIVERPAEVQVTHLEKASATVLEEGQLCVLDANKLAVEAGSDAAAVAYILEPAGAGKTTVAVLNDTRVRFKAAGDAAFAETQRGTAVANKVASGVHQVDVATAGNGALKIASDNAAGTVGETADINFYIAKTL